MVVFHDVLVQRSPLERKTFGPDIIVLRDVHIVPQDTGDKMLVHEGHPLLILDVTSERTRHQDVTSTTPERNKYARYQRLWVPAYIIVDAAEHVMVTPRISGATGCITESMCW